MDIHANAKKRLIELLAEALPQFEVLHARFIRRLPAMMLLQTAEAVLPTNGKLRDSINAYVEYDFAFSEFVIDSLSDELRDQEYLAEESPQKLVDINGFEDAKAVAKRLVEGFAALPRKYTISMKLPAELTAMIGSDKWKVELSPFIRIVRSGPELTKLYPVERSERDSGLVNLLMGNSLKWEDKALYLQIETSGFIGLYGGSTPHQEALRTIRSFCGLGLALRLFDTKSEYSVEPSPRLKIHVHQMIGDKWKALHSLDLSDALSGAIRSLRLNNVDGWITDAARQVSWAQTQLDTMKVAFAEGKKPETIQLAAQWYFDGNRDGSDELLRYIQIMVVLEILLGDKSASDQTGLNELLRNRCAYLISNSNEERDKLLDLFSKIYAVRSQIVHRGKHRLSMEERRLFGSLKLMCRRIISKELQLLAADKEGST